MISLPQWKHQRRILWQIGYSLQWLLCCCIRRLFATALGQRRARKGRLRGPVKVIESYSNPMIYNGSTHNANVEHHCEKGVDVCSSAHFFITECGLTKCPFTVRPTVWKVVLNHPISGWTRIFRIGRGCWQDDQTTGSGASGWRELEIAPSEFTVANF